MNLLGKVEVIGHNDRPVFAPRVTIRMVGGTTYQGEFEGNELEWDMATETQRITEIFDEIPWPRYKLQGIVDTVSNLEHVPTLDALIHFCVNS